MTVGRNRICVPLGRDATVLEVAMPWLHLQQSWLRCDSLEFERRQGATASEEGVQVQKAVCSDLDEIFAVD